MRLRRQNEHYDWQSELRTRSGSLMPGAVSPVQAESTKRPWHLRALRVLKKVTVTIVLPAALLTGFYLRASAHPTVAGAVVLVVVSIGLPSIFRWIGVDLKRRRRPAGAPPPASTGPSGRQPVVRNRSRLVRWTEGLFVALFMSNTVGIIVLGHHRAALGASLGLMTAIGALGLFVMQLRDRASRDPLTPAEREALARRVIREIGAELAQFLRERPREPVYEHWLTMSAKRLSNVTPELGLQWASYTSQSADTHGLVPAAELQARRTIIERLYQQVPSASGFSAVAALQGSTEPTVVRS